MTHQEDTNGKNNYEELRQEKDSYEESISTPVIVPKNQVSQVKKRVVKIYCSYLS